MRRVSINLRALCAYLFVLILIYLAGVYVGHFYYYLYVFLVVLPLYSILQVILSAFTLDAIQAIDGENPSKGDTIHYKVWITGKPLLTTDVTIRFMPVHSRLLVRIPEVRVALTGKRFVEEAFDIHMRHRGIYTVGIEAMLITDPLGWLTVRKAGSYETFAVHPRVLTAGPPIAETRVHALSESGTNGVEQDLTLFEGLAGYRDGDPVKHIAWKKYLTTGTPYLKQFGGSSEPAVEIYLDLRRPSGFTDNSETILSTEDCSIEVAIGLVKGYLARGIRVTVRAFGRGLYTFAGASAEDYTRFVRESDELCFVPDAPSPVRVYETVRSEGLVEGSILFVTHLVDERTFETASERALTGHRTGVFFNATALNEVEKDRMRSYGRALQSTSGGVFHTGSEDTLVDDLRGWEAVKK